MRTLSLRLVALCFSVAALASVESASAQETGRVEGRQATPGGYYVNYRPGEPTTRISVWGAVRNPGVYEVGPEFDIETVLSLAGGPIRPSARSTTLARSASVTDPLDVMIRVFRGGTGEPLYEASLDDFVSNESRQPALRDGDVIEVAAQPSARVSVWGAVNNPGLYEVGSGYDVEDVLSLAGGPQLRPLIDNTRRTVHIAVYRATGPGSGPVFEATMDAFIANPSAHPPLQDGDIIEVTMREKRGWTGRDTLTLLGVTASAGIAVATLINALGR
ncbi:MAG: SLBB domain-containing protein [Bacteroidota bacterium]